MDLIKCNQNRFEEIKNRIRKGEVIIFPTDTVYGIGCDPFNRDAVQRIFKVKERNKAKLLPVLGYSKEVLSKLVLFDDISSKIVKKFWPGKITLVLPVINTEIQKSMKIKEKLAVRVPNNQCTLQILKQCNYLIGTSANISNKKPFRDPKFFPPELKKSDVFIDGGIIQEGKESTICEVKDKKIISLREGDISLNQIKGAL